jgi:hypothetical protein
MIDWRKIVKKKMPYAQQISNHQEVRALITKRILHPPPDKSIIFIGSSIFRLWLTLESDMKPLQVFNQGFGGAKTWDILNYADRLVIPYQPRIIVYYCGSNDISVGEKAKGIQQRFQMFVEYISTNLPETLIFFVSINRVPEKQSKWDIVDAANDLIQKYCQKVPYLEYIDVNSALFDAVGQPKLDWLESDLVHLKPIAYQEFTKIIKPILLKADHHNFLV